jgi:hypothetical protein
MWRMPRTGVRLAVAEPVGTAALIFRPRISARLTYPVQAVNSVPTKWTHDYLPCHSTVWASLATHPVPAIHRVMGKNRPPGHPRRKECKKCVSAHHADVGSFGSPLVGRLDLPGVRRGGRPGEPASRGDMPGSTTSAGRRLHVRWSPRTHARRFGIARIEAHGATGAYASRHHAPPGAKVWPQRFAWIRMGCSAKPCG